MNRHTTLTNAGARLLGLALAAAMTAALGCSDGGDSPGTGKGGSTGKGGTTGTAGSSGAGGATAGTGGSAGGSTAGTGGATAGSGGATAGTGGATAGAGGATAGSGGSTAGTGGSAGTGGTAGGSTAGTGGSATGGTGGWPPANFPPTLNPPAGATLKLGLHATGDQIYTCTASAAGGAAGSGAGGAGGGGATTYSWVLKQPDAKLFDGTTQVGTHGLGPNWTYTSDGSVVNGARAYQENSPLSDAIPWLLLRATSNTGTGMFSDVTYVVRANTTGGKAPATGCDASTVNTETKTAYTADYFFFNGGGPGTAWMTPPGNLPAAIAVPSGATVKRHDHAIGVQVYTCTASAAGGAGGSGAGGAGGTGTGGAGGGAATTYSWVLKQPDAVLYDATFAQVGTHGVGPNWTATDGSVVNAARIAQTPSTMSGAIAWLLLQTSSTTGTGVFSDITYVQRLNTAGGPAPATGCDASKETMETRIPYSADYYFFTGGTTTTDGGTGG